MKIAIVLTLISARLFAGNSASANYSTTTEVLDAGGRAASSPNYAVHSSIGAIGSFGSFGSYANRSGFPGQLFETTGFQITFSSPFVNEGTSVSLNAFRTNSDSTLSAVQSSLVSWNVVSGPVTSVNSAGLAVNRTKLESIRDQARAESEMQTAALRDALGDRQINLASPAQLQAALAKAGLSLANTNEETLKASGDERFVPIIIAHRSAEKTAQQAQSLLECIASDGRIHGRFDPTGTATGRFSSKEPNLQNIGRGPLRECFIAPEGTKLVVADYSQIELRAAAAIAGESKMIEAYQRGEDLHRGTAAAVLGKAVDAVSKEDRQLAKAVNFGLLYGQSAPGLVKYAAASYGVTLPDDDAREIRTKFFRTYGSLRQWHGESHRRAEQGVSEVRTVLGRRRLIPPDASAWERFTALVNTPVQGGCADGMKRALVQLAAALPPSARIVSTVHDEIIVEVLEHEAEDVRRTVEAVMIKAMAALFPQVPVEVEANVCASWGDK